MLKPFNGQGTTETIDFGLFIAYQSKKVYIMALRDIFPIKYYSKEGFIERKLEINEKDLQEIIEYYLTMNADFEFDEVEVVNNPPMNIWLYAKCRKYIDPDNPDDDTKYKAEVEISGDYDGNPTGF